MSKFIKLLAASDSHGQFVDQQTVKALLEFKKQFKPDYTAFLGDVFDYVAIMGSASADDKTVSLQTDFEAGIEFIRSYAPDLITWGNHDFRMTKLTQCNDAVKRDLAKHIMSDLDDLCGDLKIQQIPYGKREGIHRIGKLRMAHGYGSAAKMNSAYGNIIFGHIHNQDRHYGATYDRTVAQCVGCLCNTEFTYNNSQLACLKQEQGFLAAIISKTTGDFELYPIKKLNGKFVWPTGFNL